MHVSLEGAPPLQLGHQGLEPWGGQSAPPNQNYQGRLYTAFVPGCSRDPFAFHFHHLVHRARRKAQKFRRNVLEIASLPAVRCGHIHDPSEWRSSQIIGQFSTFTEAEYTPSLVFNGMESWPFLGCHLSPPLATFGHYTSLSAIRIGGLDDCHGLPPVRGPAGRCILCTKRLVISFKTGPSSTRMMFTSALATFLIDGR